MSRPKKKNRCSRRSREIIAKYHEIISDIRAKGYKVIHKKLPKAVAGYFNPDNCDIEVDRTIRNTIEGCYTLLHEYQHAMDYREGKFKEFFDMNEDTEYSDINLERVIEAETHAAKGAQKRLKVYGIIYTPTELTEKGLKDCIVFWKEEYFKKP